MKIRSIAIKYGTPIFGLLGSAAAFAEDSARATAIKAAETAAQSDIALAVSAVIGAAALMFGVGFIVGLMRK